MKLTYLFAAIAFGLAAPAAAAENATTAPFLIKSATSSTIPANGDLNPYGIAFTPKGFPAGGKILAGDVLVSNFNDINNLQGVGTTIIHFMPSQPIAPLVAPGSAGTAKVFFSSPRAGLTTALGVLKGGFVIVGNLPTKDGTFATVGQGALQIIDRNGNLVATWIDPQKLDSPWDLTIDDAGTSAKIYVSNVISATVTRLDVSVGSNMVTVLSKTTIASGYAWAPNASALVIGPTGLVHDQATDALYVASTDDNKIFMVPHAATRTSSAGPGTVVFANAALRGPVGLSAAPNGDLIAANGDAVNGSPTHPSEMIEFTTAGDLVTSFNVDAGQGGAFGLALKAGTVPMFDFAYVDDVPNVVIVTSLPR